MVRSRPKGGPIAALDVGSTKVACFIAEQDDNGSLRITGVGHHQSRGMRAGQVADMAGLEASVRAAVEGAEQMAATRIDGVFVSVTGGGLMTQNLDVSLALGDHPVRDTDVRRLLDQGRALATHRDPERELLHCLPTTYTLDGGDGIVDPRGMHGNTLGVRIHTVLAGHGVLRNLATVIERCHLDVLGWAAGPHAAALACTVDDEKETGVTVLDMGGGTTGLSVFLDGHPVFADVVPIGGSHVTSDVAKLLPASTTDAEKLKTVWGTVIPAPADDSEMLRVTQIGEEDEAIAVQEMARAKLVRIIRPRLEETFELVRARLHAVGLLHATGRRVVLTGGASQLQGVREMAEIILDKQVRLGRPRRLRGLPEAASGPAFAACAGLLRYAVQDHVITRAPAAVGSETRSPTRLPPRVPAPAPRRGPPRGSMLRALTWLRENF